ncbi:TRAP transporter TatT component family protein [Reinekea sp.]|jgi:hypothetical protein|uniref:TRAP transporter TatT component family protein n=1 Tax=Reinekea sp. TaxID=1970455 RepID=UPI002A82350B|nr:TRAP transporter TatT component family protein [Reinekea sp.]
MMKTLILLATVLSLTGCATTRLPANLSNAILNSDDLVTVNDGLPAYLLMIDALSATYPKSESLHLTAASLNGAYAGVFVPDDQKLRKKRMSEKALNHALQAFCLHDKTACALQADTREDFAGHLAQWRDAKDLPYLYALGTSWASYIEANSDDWLVIAQLGLAESILKQVVSIEPGYEKGTALLYLGVMGSILPPSLGGKPDIAQGYFEAALAAGNNENLIIHVYYAANFARLMFDQELHDRMLQQALSLDPYVEGYTLQNVFAQQQAQQLLESSNDYF